MEAVYRYNATLGDDVSGTSAPANVVYNCCVWVKGIDEMCDQYRIGDLIWVKPPNN